MTGPARNIRGFTMIELLVASSLAAFAMMALLSGFVFLGRNFTRLANLQALQTQSRTALAYLQSDVALARSVKPGTAPTATTVTLVLPGGEVVYSYDATTERLRRQASFGSQPDLYLLTAPNCRCTAFAINYATGENGSTLDQVSPTTHNAYSIKRVQFSFELQTPSSQSTQTRVQYKGVSPQLTLRNKEAPHGT